MDFPSNAPTPSYPAPLDRQYRTRGVDFGDGYTQRFGDGLNTKRDTVEMQWNTITEAEKNILVDFFDEREGYKAFNYTVPGDSEEKKYIAPGVKVDKLNSTYYNVRATFTLVYDL